jgi:hypothetical protein
MLKVNTLTAFNAYSSGKPKLVPNKPKLVLTGEALTLTKLSPTVSCHHGTNSDVTKTIIVNIPAEKPYQFITRFSDIILACHHNCNTMHTCTVTTFPCHQESNTIVTNKCKKFIRTASKKGVFLLPDA